MSKYLERAEELRNCQSTHYNCAQAVLIPFAKELGMSEDMAFKLASNFGSGMKIGSACGAFTGALMVLGLYGLDQGSMVGAFARKVKENHWGNLDCAALLKKSKELGQEKKAHCDGMVYECIEILEEILKENGKI